MADLLNASLRTTTMRLTKISLERAQARKQANRQNLSGPRSIQAIFQTALDRYLDAADEADRAADSPPYDWRLPGEDLYGR